MREIEEQLEDWGYVDEDKELTDKEQLYRLMNRLDREDEVATKKEERKADKEGHYSYYESDESDEEEEKKEKKKGDEDTNKETLQA